MKETIYLHLGQNTVVRSDQIIGVFDMDNSTVSPHTKKYLAQAQRDGRVTNVSMELPKSFIVCGTGDRQTVYISQLSPATLLRRFRAGASE